MHSFGSELRYHGTFESQFSQFHHLRTPCFSSTSFTPFKFPSLCNEKNGLMKKTTLKWNDPFQTWHWWLFYSNQPMVCGNAKLGDLLVILLVEVSHLNHCGYSLWNETNASFPGQDIWIIDRGTWLQYFLMKLNCLESITRKLRPIVLTHLTRRQRPFHEHFAGFRSEPGRGLFRLYSPAGVQSSAGKIRRWSCWIRKLSSTYNIQVSTVLDMNLCGWFTLADTFDPVPACVSTLKGLYCT